MKKIMVLAILMSFLLINASFALVSYKTTKFAVSISESIDNIEKESMSACENAIEKKLIGAGYRVIHNKYVEDFDETKEYEELMRIEESYTESATPDASMTDKVAPTVESTEMTEITLAIKDKIKADIIIIGEANSSLLSEGPTVQTAYTNIYSARANGHIKVIWVDTGQVLAAVSEIQSGAEVSEPLAHERTLMNLGKKIGEKIVDKLSEYDIK